MKYICPVSLALTSRLSSRSSHAVTVWVRSSIILLGLIVAPASQARNINERIAVIGSGISGLSAAHSLRKLGYQDVTVYEKADRPGGKIKTIYREGVPYEIGADWISNEYDTIKTFIDEYDIPTKSYNASKLVFQDQGQELKLGQYLVQKYGFWSTLASYWRFKALYQAYRKTLDEPGLHQEFDPELFMPIGQFVVKHQIEPIAKAVELFMVACGYGYFDRTPTLYILEMMDLVINAGVRDIISDTINVDAWGWKYFPEGYQSLAQKMADRLGVQYNKELTSIKRSRIEGQDQVDLSFRDGSKATFDRVIVAFSAKHLPGILDTSAEEQEIFSKIKSIPYYSTLFRADGLRQDIWIGLFANSLTADRQGHIIALGSYPYGTSIYQSTQFGGASPDATLEFAKQDVASLGGTMTEVMEQNKWEYFYHVNEADLRNGFFKQFFSLQGRGGVYYASGPASMESVEESAKFSAYLVKTFF